MPQSPPNLSTVLDTQEKENVLAFFYHTSEAETGLLGLIQCCQSRFWTAWELILSNPGITFDIDRSQSCPGVVMNDLPVVEWLE